MIFGSDSLIGDSMAEAYAVIAGYQAVIAPKNHKVERSKNLANASRRILTGGKKDTLRAKNRAKHYQPCGFEGRTLFHWVLV